MTTRRQRRAERMQEAEEADELILTERFPDWAAPRVKPVGWLTDIATVDDPISFGRTPTDAEIVAFKQKILAERREDEEYRLKSLMGTKDTPEHLNNTAAEIRAHRKGQHYDPTHEEK